VSYDVLISMDEAGFNRIIATLYSRPRLRDSLFKGSEVGAFSGVNANVSWEVLQAPTMVFSPPTPEQWSRSIKEDGTAPQPTQNALIARIPKMRVSRQSSQGDQDATISLDAICTVGLRNNELVIDALAVIIDLSAATPLDRLIFTKVIIPKTLAMADSLLSGRQIPSIDFKGISFGAAALGVGNGRMVGVANLVGKPTPALPDFNALPHGSFYILLSREALRLVANAGAQGLRGQTANRSGSESFTLGRANYNARVRLDNVSAQVTPDVTVVSASVGINASADAGIDVVDIIAGAVTTAGNAIADTATTAGNAIVDTANKVGDAFKSY
jgi:hypothetical protein